MGRYPGSAQDDPADVQYPSVALLKNHMSSFLVKISRSGEGLQHVQTK